MYQSLHADIVLPFDGKCTSLSDDRLLRREIVPPPIRVPHLASSIFFLHAVQVESEFDTCDAGTASCYLHAEPNVND
jgi:hypothetical protein